MRSVNRTSLVLALCAGLTGCGDDDETAAPRAADDAATPADAGEARDAWSPPAVDARVENDASQVDAATTRDPNLDGCWPGRWCWVEGAPIVALDGAGRDTVYAADDGGRLWHWDGAVWQPVERMGSRRVRQVHVGDANDLFVIAEHDDAPGRFFVDRFDGRRWSTLRSDVDPRFLRGFGSENLWVRDRETLRWLRFDGRAWWAVELPDPEHLDVVYDDLYAKLLPGPGSSAYAIAVTRIDGSAPPPRTTEVIVMRFDGEAWERMGVLSTGWASLAWVDGEPRVVAYEDRGSEELRYDGEAWVRARWVPAGTATEGHWLAGTNRGVALVPAGRSCLDVLPVGDETFCTVQGWAGVLESFVARADARGAWSDTAPASTRPLASEMWNEVAPGYFAAGSRRAWGSGPHDVLRLREAGVSWGATMLERIDGTVVTPVLDEADQPVFATQVDGVAGEDAWVAGRNLYRVSGARARIVPMPEELAWVDVFAVAAEPGGRAWALASGSDRAFVVRIEGDVAWIDYEMPNDVLEAETPQRAQLRDIALDAIGDVWVLGAIGARSGHGLLLHRGPGVRCGPVWRSVPLWDEAFSAKQIVHYDGALYISGVSGVWNTTLGAWLGGSYVVRLPIESLADDVVAEPASDFALGRAPESLADQQLFPTESDFAFDFQDPELWVGASGVWLTRPNAARRFVERL